MVPWYGTRLLLKKRTKTFPQTAWVVHFVFLWFSLLMPKKVSEKSLRVEISSPFCTIERDQMCVAHQRRTVILWKRITLLVERDNNHPSLCILAKSNRSENCCRPANIKTKEKTHAFCTRTVGGLKASARGLYSKCHNFVIMRYWSRRRWAIWIPIRLNVTVHWPLTWWRCLSRAPTVKSRSLVISRTQMTARCLGLACKTRSGSS